MRTFSSLLLAAVAAVLSVSSSPSLVEAALPGFVSVVSTQYASYPFTSPTKPAFSVSSDVITAYNKALQGIQDGQSYCTVDNIDLTRFSGRPKSDTQAHGLCNVGTYNNVIFAVTVVIQTTQASTISIRAGCDMGYGGILTLDNNVVDFQNQDMWWEYNFNNPGSDFLVAKDQPLPAGRHTIVLLGAEDGSNAGSELDFSFGTSGYTPVTPPVNPKPVPPPTPILPPGVIGDPQFTGFMGQSYQVHGTSDSIYNIISTPSFQYNALFRYLESGKCRVGTPCYSHPGNYFGSVGMMIKDSNNVITPIVIESGDVTKGLTVFMNNQTLSASSSAPVQIGSYKLTVESEFEVLLESNEFNLRIQNSDNFLNQDVSIGSDLMNSIVSYKRVVKSEGELSDAAVAAAAKLPHGVLGQTWSAKTYDNRWKYIQGQLFDYVTADGLLGKQFKYNKF